ncbi:MAG: ABC transporter ATP-binding protein [Cyclobacteriaceae bacterium]|nr:ABC transporter ATP-binding protein [Cyclobacteriaceae bacterium]
MKSVIVNSVQKSFKANKASVQALKEISFDVEQGELFGLIGPDGAGKTTLFRILTTLMIADSGTASVDGFDVVKDFKAIRKQVGYMPGRFSLYQDLSVQENLSFFATLFDTTIEENYELVKDIYIQIEKFKHRKAGALSGGMKQKLALCCALIHKPSVLFLDEPTTGVDAVSRQEFWELLRQLQKQNITIVVSTPYMDEASLCDRVALIQQGSLLGIDTPMSIMNKLGKPLWSARASDMYALMKELKSMDKVFSCYPFGQEHHVIFHNDGQSVAEIETALKQKGIVDVQLKRTEPTIEDSFMKLMKQ